MRAVPARGAPCALLSLTLPLLGTSAFLQRDAWSQKAGAEKKSIVEKKSSSEQAGHFVSSLLVGASKMVQNQLREQETDITRLRNAIMSMNRYVDQVKASLGRKGTLFGDVAGILPAGPFDQDDKRVAGAFMDLLGNSVFREAFYTGIDTMGEQIAAYVSRTDRKVSDLVVKGAGATEQDLMKYIGLFFTNQNHVMGFLVNSTEKVLKSLVAAMPSNYSTVKLVADPIVGDLMDHARGVIANNTEKMAQSSGSEFCGKYDMLITEDLLPLLNRTMRHFPKLSKFAAANANSTVPHAKQAVKRAKWVQESLQMLEQNVDTWIEKICGLVGAAATQ